MEKEETKLSVERQKYQLHKKGYESITDAIKNIPKTEVKLPANVTTETIEIPALITLEMSETNKILSEIVKSMNEPLCVKLILK